MVLVGIGLGLTVSPIGTAVINDANESQRGVASALVIILRLVGMTVAISSLTAFAINRVTHLVSVASSQFPIGLTPEQIQQQSVAAYFAAGIQVVDELLIIGAIVCAFAIVPALFLQGNARVEADDLIAERHRLEREPSSGR
jgi:hypothetical protein